MTNKERNRQTGTDKLPDLWHFGEGGTLGARNLGTNLYDLAEACEQCGRPTQGLLLCDSCSDLTAPNS